MKTTPFVLAAILLAAGPARAQAESSNTADIPGPVSGSVPATPAPLPVLPEFKIKSTVVREMDVVEAPPMSGLPPVEGTITATVHLVEDPKLPDPLPQSDGPAGDPVRLERFQEAVRRHQAIHNVSVSATVYDHHRTQLRCYPNGHPEKAVTVWSNVDFTCFGGVGIFEVRNAEGAVIRKYNLFMMLTGVDTKQRAELLAKHGREYVPPVIPALADGAPAYVVQNEAPDAAALEIIEDLHTLFRCEGQQIKTAYQNRLADQERRRAYLLEHPPVPEDVTIHFWERDHALGESAGDGGKEAVEP